MPCGVAFCLFFLLPSNFSISAQSSDTPLTRPQIPQHLSPVVFDFDFTGMPELWYWATMIQGDFSNKLFIGTANQVLPDNFMINFRQGLDFGIRYKLVVEAEGNGTKLLIGLLMLVFAAISVGALVYTSVQLNRFDKFGF